MKPRSASDTTGWPLSRSAAGIAFRDGGAGAPLLLLHGTACSSRAWQPVVARLSPSWRPIVPDFPGHGDSAMLPEAPTAASFARRLVDLLDELGLERVPVVGNSMGGWTALELAKLGRASGALALCPAGMWEQSAPRYCRVSLGATRLLARASRPLRRQIAGSALGRTACFGQVCATPSRVAPATAVEAMHDVARAADFWRHWLHGNRGRFSGGDAITVPVTVIWGGRDRLLLARQARRIDELPPGAVVSTVPEWGHIPLWSDPDGTAATIARTFASSRGRSSPLEPVDG